MYNPRRPLLRLAITAIIMVIAALTFQMSDTLPKSITGWTRIILVESLYLSAGLTFTWAVINFLGITLEYIMTMGENDDSKV